MSYVVKFIQYWNGSFGGSPSNTIIASTDNSSGYDLSSKLGNIDVDKERYIADDFFLREPRRAKVSFLTDEWLYENFFLPKSVSGGDYRDEINVYLFYDENGNILEYTDDDNPATLGINDPLDDAIIAEKEVLIQQISKIILEIWQDDEKIYTGLINKAETSYNLDKITISCVDFLWLIKTFGEQLIKVIKGTNYGVVSSANVSDKLLNKIEDLTNINLNFNVSSFIDFFIDISGSELVHNSFSVNSGLYEDMLNNHPSLNSDYMPVEVVDYAVLSNLQELLSHVAIPGQNLTTTIKYFTSYNEQTNFCQINTIDKFKIYITIPIVKINVENLMYIDSLNEYRADWVRVKVQTIYILMDLDWPANTMSWDIVQHAEHTIDNLACISLLEQRWLSVVLNYYNDSPELFQNIFNCLEIYMSLYYEGGSSHRLVAYTMDNIFYMIKEPYYSVVIPVYNDTYTYLDLLKTILFLNNVGIYVDKNGVITFMERDFVATETPLTIEQRDILKPYLPSPIQKDENALEAMTKVWYDEETNGQYYVGPDGSFLDTYMKNFYISIFNTHPLEVKCGIERVSVVNGDIYDIYLGRGITMPDKFGNSHTWVIIGLKKSKDDFKYDIHAYMFSN